MYGLLGIDRDANHTFDETFIDAAFDRAKATASDRNMDTSQLKCARDILRSWQLRSIYDECGLQGVDLLNVSGAAPKAAFDNREESSF